MANRADVAIAGAGILGLAHAYSAARRGKSVVVFERGEKASGASIRNFGMIWPIGQPPGPMREMALRSAALWREILEAARLPFNATGSLHAVYRKDEEAVAREFSEIAPGHGYECQWLDAGSALEKSQALVETNLRGALWSPAEFTVDPRLTIAALPGFLRERYGVRFQFATAVRSIELPVFETSNGRWEAERAIVCGGDDFETLFPYLFRHSPVTRCKLQMLRTGPQPEGWRLGPSLAAGLTLRFYPAFEICSTLPALKSRIADETPEFDRWGIHVLVSQTALGELTLGDSHQYGRAVDIFDQTAIDGLIMGYARGFLRAPALEIAERWHGVYSRHPCQPFISEAPAENVRVVTGVGGSGMTLSFGLAEQTIGRMGI